MNIERKMCFSMPSPSELDHLIKFCQVMAASSFYQKLGASGVMVIYLTAKEYNLPFMACLNGGLHTFDGKVTFSAIMIDALILQAGHTIDILQLDERKCVIKFTRGDRKHDPKYVPLVYEYTIDQAAKAGYLNKNNWKTSPKDMLYSRCLTGGGRKHVPEVLVGILVAGELVGVESDSNIQPVLPAQAREMIENQESKVQAIEEPKKTLEISNEEHPLSRDLFCQKHEINSDDEITLWVEKISKETGRTFEQTLDAAMKNEDRFLKAYEMYQQKIKREKVA